MIKSSDLENRAAMSENIRGEDVANVANEELQRLKGKPRKPETEAATGPTLTDRLAAARNVRPNARDRNLHCGHCFGEGRDAAIRAFEGAAAEDPGR